MGEAKNVQVSEAKVLEKRLGDLPFQSAVETSESPTPKLSGGCQWVPVGGVSLWLVACGLSLVSRVQVSRGKFRLRETPSATVPHRVFFGENVNVKKPRFSRLPASGRSQRDLE